MTQGNRDCNDMSLVLENLRIALEETDKYMSDELDIQKPNILQATDQILEKKKYRDTNSIYDFRNILLDNLWQNGFHLNNTGKGNLLHNLLVSLNKS